MTVISTVFADTWNDAMCEHPLVDMVDEPFDVDNVLLQHFSKKCQVTDRVPFMFSYICLQAKSCSKRQQTKKRKPVQVDSSTQLPSIEMQKAQEDVSSITRTMRSVSKRNPVAQH